MSSVHARIQPNSHLFLQLPSDLLKVVEIKPNTIVDIGKLGSFPSNLLLGRPYYNTYELLDRWEGETFSRLRLVPTSELNAEIVTEDATPAESRGELASPSTINGVPEGYDLLAEDGTIVMKNNRLTVDDASRQALSQQEIEELKRSAGGKEIIEKILANHAGLDEKTAFSKAKYTLRKTKKYVKRFSVLPMNMEHLIDYVLEKEPPRIMELRMEALGLICAWSNAHYNGEAIPSLDKNGKRVGGGRWLVVDDTGGLVVAAIAERMGILYPSHDGSFTSATQESVQSSKPDDVVHGANGVTGDADDQHNVPSNTSNTSPKHTHRDFPLPAATNSMTLLHSAVQPNISLLKYFGYDTNQPDTSHPLHDHLKPLSYLQLLHPEDDPLYHEPEVASEAEMQSWKSAKRGGYWKKRRRWERCKSIVDETREGGFDGLVIASTMDPATILPHTVPLVRGGGHIVVYSPTVEPVINVMDLYSKERRSAYIHQLSNGEVPDPADFPVDPRLLLAPTLQTSRVRDWQVLPGRTHPMMTSRGGAEGYIFTASRVIPLAGTVEARGNFSDKKRKADDEPAATT